MTPEQRAALAAEWEGKLEDDGLGLDNREKIRYRKVEKNTHNVEAFIKANYPGDAEHMINSAIEGYTVLKEVDGIGEIEGILSYGIERDPKDQSYMKFGLVLVKKANKGEGIASKLMNRLEKVAAAKGCHYITAKADTPEGARFLMSNGFEERGDEETGQQYYHRDL